MRYLRMKKNKEFQKLFSKGKRSYASSLAILYLPSEKTRMGICVGKKHGKAHVRNRIKRLLREAFRKHADKLVSPHSFVLLPKVQEEYSFAEYDACILKLLKREKLI